MAITIEKAIVPITIGAAVLGIWAALRKPSQAPIVVQGGGGNLVFPQVGLDDTAGASPSSGQVTQAFGSPSSQTPVDGGPATMVGSGVQGTPSYPSAYASGLPSTYFSALPSWKNGVLRHIANAFNLPSGMSQNSAKNGCSGGCGGCGTSSKCKSGSMVPNKLQDGSGDCYAPLYSVPSATPAEWGNFISYSVEKQIIPVDPSAVGVVPDFMVH